MGFNTSIFYIITRMLASIAIDEPNNPKRGAMLELILIES